MVIIGKIKKIKQIIKTNAGRNVVRKFYFTLATFCFFSLALTYFALYRVGYGDVIEQLWNAGACLFTAILSAFISISFEIEMLKSHIRREVAEEVIIPIEVTDEDWNETVDVNDIN